MCLQLGSLGRGGLFRRRGKGGETPGKPDRGGEGVCAALNGNKLDSVRVRLVEVGGDNGPVVRLVMKSRRGGIVSGFGLDILRDVLYGLLDRSGASSERLAERDFARHSGAAVGLVLKSGRGDVSGVGLGILRGVLCELPGPRGAAG